MRGDDITGIVAMVYKMMNLGLTTSAADAQSSTQRSLLEVAIDHLADRISPAHQEPHPDLRYRRTEWEAN